MSPVRRRHKIPRFIQVARPSCVYAPGKSSGGFRHRRRQGRVAASSKYSWSSSCWSHASLWFLPVPVAQL